MTLKRSTFVNDVRPKLSVVPILRNSTSEDDSKIAERRELYLSRMRGTCVDVVRPKLSGVPIPKTPTSEDYSQFSEIMSNDLTSRTILMVFKEVFHTDSEDRIIRITDRLSNPNLHSAIDGEYRSFIDDTLGQSVDPTLPQSITGFNTD